MNFCKGLTHFVTIKTIKMRTDFENLRDGDEIILYPNKDNPLHKKPVKASFWGGYFFCNNIFSEDGPTYYLGDVSRYNHGFDLVN